MIWLIAMIMALATALYVCAPLYAQDEPELIGEDIGAYRAELQSTDLPNSTDMPNSTNMQRQLLQRASPKALQTGVPKAWLLAVFLGTLIGAGGIYAALGMPDFERAEMRAAMSLSRQATRENMGANLTPEQRSEMITAMVEGLAARLQEDPENVAGWTRLLRSRIVLGQTEQAGAEIKLMRETYKDRPEIIGKIFVESGWAELMGLQPPVELLPE